MEFSCFSVQAITTPVVYYGKVLSGGKGIANVPVTDGTQIVLTDDKDDIPYQVPLMQNTFTSPFLMAIIFR